MDNRIAAWQLAKESLEKNIPAILLYVVESIGSSPGRRDFFMVVNSEHQMKGSIGGGIMEHKMVELAFSKLHENPRTASIYKQIHNKEATTNQSGMICSGEQTIVQLKLSFDDEKVIDAIIADLQKNKNGWLRIDKNGLQWNENKNSFEDNPVWKNEEDWRYENLIGVTNHLHIIGGGHCSLALSKLMSGMDFFISLYETRKDLNTFLENDFVHEKKLLKDYSELSTIVEEENNYVIIMTFGYRTDDIALRALIGKDFRYIGMLGSKTKIEKLKKQFINDNIDKALLQKLNAPAGIQINSKTPEEIAVSIAAEIIRIKNSIE